MSTPAWILEARKHIGQREAPGPAENPWIVSLWKAIKRGGIKSESVPWCAAFVGACMEACGLMSTRFESAASYESWGQKLPGPFFGAVGVLVRPGGGHVGFVVGRDGSGNIALLGGNQSDAVNVRMFPVERFVAFRWPAPVPLPDDLPLPLVDASASSSEA